MPRIHYKRTEDSDIYKKRHSASHVLAQAVLELFPEAQLGIGPATEEGFYYDFLLPRSLTQEDLEKIEKRMKEVIKEGHEFVYQEIDIEQAKQMFCNQRYKIELINELAERGERLSIYKHGDFFDLCKGPHTESLKNLNPDGLKLLHVAGAYWRGDENRDMLQRIYGTYFDSAELLKQWLNDREEAQKYDHKNLGRQLRLFTVSQSVGSGLIIWLPQGATLRRLIEEFNRDLVLANGYRLVYTPHIGKADLWKQSGHLDHYRDSMFPAMRFDNDEYFVKPMNCPFHIQIYKELVKSFRDLPLRLAEYGTVYRYERHGTLNGLTRARGFTQDDGHIFCTAEQLEGELCNLLDIANAVLQRFDFSEYTIYVSTKPGNYVGDDQIWEEAERKLMKVLDDKNLYYYVDEGGGAFYGPKIDIKVKDSFSREWQLTTIQLDFNLPKKFNLDYIDSSGEQKAPIMIHRAFFGSIERFIGVLIEHYKGNFPFWLAPEQIRLLPVSEKFNEYAKSVAVTLQGYRLTIDDGSERLGYKIRRAELDKVPYMLILGEKEQSTNTVSVRSKERGDLGSIAIDKLRDFFTQQ